MARCSPAIASRWWRRLEKAKPIRHGARAISPRRNSSRRGSVAIPRIRTPTARATGPNTKAARVRGMPPAFCGCAWAGSPQRVCASICRWWRAGPMRSKRGRTGKTARGLRSPACRRQRRRVKPLWKRWCWTALEPDFSAWSRLRLDRTGTTPIVLQEDWARVPGQRTTKARRARRRALGSGTGVEISLADSRISFPSVVQPTLWSFLRGELGRAFTLPRGARVPYLDGSTPRSLCKAKR